MPDLPCRILEVIALTHKENDQEKYPSSSWRDQNIKNPKLDIIRETTHKILHLYLFISSMELFRLSVRAINRRIWIPSGEWYNEKLTPRFSQLANSLLVVESR